MYNKKVHFREQCEIGFPFQNYVILMCLYAFIHFDTLRRINLRFMGIFNSFNYKHFVFIRCSF